MMDPQSDEYSREKREKARQLFEQQRVIYNPYFCKEVLRNSDGFRRLHFSARRGRSKECRKLKLGILPLVFGVIRKSGVIQEYQETLKPIGKRHCRDGSFKRPPALPSKGKPALIRSGAGGRNGKIA